jgi:flagellar biosynthetic protein FliP
MDSAISSLIPGGNGNWSHMLALSALSLAPAILLMTTCFVRIAVVLGLLRQALGMSQLPPTQVLTALSLFMTALVMTPVWTDIYRDAIVPYQEARTSGSAATIPWEETWSKGVAPLRKFMSRQIDRAGNDEDVWLFYGYLPESRVRPTPTTYDEIPLQALLPAFLLSELKVAFLIGFQICLPFLIVDLVVASVTTSMGMMMVPPGVVSLPLKLLLFVLLDGWRLVVGMLLDSFAPYS